MLRPLTGLPPGVIGFEAVGEVHADDYRTVLRPAIDEAAAAGSVRLVYVLGMEFTGYSAGAAWQDARLGFDHPGAWRRAAIVSDLPWVEHLVGLFGWMVPGELQRFPLAERDDAVRWVGGEGEVPGAEPGPVASTTATALPGPAASPTAPVAPAEASAPDHPAAEGTPDRGQPGAAEAEPAEPRPEADATAETEAAASPTEVLPASGLGNAQTVTPTAPLAPGAGMRPGMAAAAPPTPPTPTVPAQWAADPTGRHQHRWWDGRQWTEHVADGGVQAVDPLA